MADRVLDLIPLRDAVAQRLANTQRQIDDVDLRLPVTIVTFLVSLGLAYYFQSIILCWVPVSFLIMSIWAIYGFFKNSLPVFNRTRIEDIGKEYDKWGKDAMNYGSEWLFKAVVPLSCATGVIFIITLLALLAVMLSIIEPVRTIHLIYPIAVSIYFVLPMFQRIKAKQLNSNIYQSKVWALPFIQKRGFKVAIKTLQLIVYLIVVIIPILALVMTLPLILPLGEKLLYIAVTILLQLMLLAISGSYFSALLVKRELANTITNLTIIADSINELILNKNITEKRVRYLREQYTASKIYELKTEDFIVLNYYFLIMRKDYLEKLIEGKNAEGS